MLCFIQDDRLFRLKDFIPLEVKREFFLLQFKVEIGIGKGSGQCRFAGLSRPEYRDGGIPDQALGDN
jgi:hypothetical protein